MKERHNKYVIMIYYHYFNHGIIIKTDTTTTLNQIWHAVTEKLYKDRLKLNRNSEQNNQTKLTIKTERLVQSKTYVSYRV
jgi:hypothetical protein